MKNKFLSIILILSIITGVFTGVCLVANAENGESPNLLEMYGFNPNFDDGIEPWVTNGGIAEQSDEDSSDDDGFCLKVSSRTQNYATARLLGTETALKIFEEQGAGQYYYAFSVKCVKKGATAKIKPAFQLVYGGANVGGTNVGKWPSGTAGTTGVDVGNKWVRIETVIDVETEIDGKVLGSAILYSMEVDFNAKNAADLYFDDVVLIKKTGGWVDVTPEPEVEVPSQTRVEDVKRSDKTGIGAIYYHMWFETLEDWWKYDNSYATANDRSSVQDARCLAPDKHHYRLPFFTVINEQVSSSSQIKGSVLTGVPEFPEFTKEIWEQEMNYAIESGIDFMAYLWSASKRHTEGAYMYHIESKGLDGKLKMCAVLQNPMKEDLNTMATAMCEDYWYTVDGMPVVYIYGATDNATEDSIARIRKKVAIAQYVKYGEVGKPVYIIGMGPTSYSSAVGISSRGLDAVGWYGINATGAITDEVKAQWEKQGIKNDALTIKSVTFKGLADYALTMMKEVSKVWDKGYVSVSPLITLGRNVLPRIENPVSWSPATEKALPYQGTYAEDPTPEEVTKNVLDVLNWNKEANFSCNTVIMYCWNEYSEGGWFCPTIAVDANGKVLKNADGTNKINREYLDAVKEGIALYRKHETENAIYDEEGNKIKDIVDTTQAPKVTNSPTVTEAPIVENQENNQENNQEVENNGWVLWAIIGGAVVVAAAAAVVVVIVLKKKKAEAPSQESAE